MKRAPKFSKSSHQLHFTALAQLTAGLNVGVFETLRGSFSDAPDLFHREGRQEVFDLLISELKLPVRLSPVTRDFREKLVRSNASRSGELGLVSDSLPDLPGDGIRFGAKM